MDQEDAAIERFLSYYSGDRSGARYGGGGRSLNRRISSWDSSDQAPSHSQNSDPMGLSKKAILERALEIIREERQVFGSDARKNQVMENSFREIETSAKGLLEKYPGIVLTSENPRIEQNNWRDEEYMTSSEQQMNTGLGRGLFTYNEGNDWNRGSDSVLQSVGGNWNRGKGFASRIEGGNSNRGRGSFARRTASNSNRGRGSTTRSEGGNMSRGRGRGSVMNSGDRNWSRGRGRGSVPRGEIIGWGRGGQRSMWNGDYQNRKRDSQGIFRNQGDDLFSDPLFSDMQIPNESLLNAPFPDDDIPDRDFFGMDSLFPEEENRMLKLNALLDEYIQSRDLEPPQKIWRGDGFLGDRDFNVGLSQAGFPGTSDYRQMRGGGFPLNRFLNAGQSRGGFRGRNRILQMKEGIRQNRGFHAGKLGGSPGKIKNMQMGGGGFGSTGSFNAGKPQGGRPLGTNQNIQPGNKPTLYVSNLPNGCKERRLVTYFSQFGKVHSVYIERKVKTLQALQVGKVVFYRPRGLAKALNGRPHIIDSKHLKSSRLLKDLIPKGISLLGSDLSKDYNLSPKVLTPLPNVEKKKPKNPKTKEQKNLKRERRRLSRALKKRTRECIKPPKDPHSLCIFCRAFNEQRFKLCYKKSSCVECKSLTQAERRDLRRAWGTQQWDTSHPCFWNMAIFGCSIRPQFVKVDSAKCGICLETFDVEPDLKHLQSESHKKSSSNRRQVADTEFNASYVHCLEVFRHEQESGAEMKFCDKCFLSYGNIEVHKKKCVHKIFAKYRTIDCYVCGSYTMYPEGFRAWVDSEKHFYTYMHLRNVWHHKVVTGKVDSHYNEPQNFGADFVKIQDAQWCKVCKKFLAKGGEALMAHCKTKEHFDKTKQLAERRRAKETGDAEKGVDDDSDKEDEVMNEEEKEDDEVKNEDSNEEDEIMNEEGNEVEVKNEEGNEEVEVKNEERNEEDVVMNEEENEVEVKNEEGNEEVEVKNEEVNKEDVLRN